MKKAFITIFTATLLSGCGKFQKEEARTLEGLQKEVDFPADSLRMVLEEMYDSDQGIRKELVEAMSKDPRQLGGIIEKMNHTDSLNQEQVKLILEKYGWLERSRVGEKASGAVFYVVQHAPLYLMEKYFPQLQQLAVRGEANTTDVALMQDRILMYNNKRQLYGTQASNLVRAEQITVIWPVEDPAGINARRKAVGFQDTVEESARDMNAIYDSNEALPAVNPWN